MTERCNEIREHIIQCSECRERLHLQLSCVDNGNLNLLPKLSGKWIHPRKLRFWEENHYWRKCIFDTLVSDQ